MALRKKTSRLIKIDSTTYRWTVSTDSGYNVFVAQKEEMGGQKIEVYMNQFEIESPNVKGLSLKILKPKEAELIIRQALSLDWKPEEKGKPIVFDWKHDKLIKRKEQ